MNVAANASLNEYLRSVGSVLLLPAGGSAASAGDSKEAAGPALVLLSEREANGLLEKLWCGSGGGNSGSGSKGTTPVPLLACLTYAAAVQQPGLNGQRVLLRLATALRAGGSSWWAPGSLESTLRDGAFMRPLVSTQLFNGETTFVPQRGDARWEDVRRAPALVQLASLAGGHAPAAEALVDMRGKASFFLRSQLERACTG